MSYLKSDIILRRLEYITVFFGFFVMFLFIVPQSDVFLFAHATDGSLSSVVTYSLQYGNGRLLGNLISIYFSSHFAFSGFIVALSLTLVVALLNHIILENQVWSVFPLALLVAFPSTGMLGECYYLFAAFCNYVIPVVFFLISIQMQKHVFRASSSNSAQQYLLLPVSLLFAVGSCLFSENTTLVIIVTSVLFIVYQYLHTKHLSLRLLLYLASVLTGALIMFLIPILTGTKAKMLSYRNIPNTPLGILKQVTLSFLEFSNIFNQMYLTVILLSIAMLLLCMKQQRFRNSIKKIQLAVFVAYPFLCTGLSMIDSNSLVDVAAALHAVDAVLVIIFAANILLTILLTEEKSVRLILWFFVVAVISSVAPMMIVSPNGYRTYYTTFLCVLIMAIWLLRQNIAEYFHNEAKKFELRRCFLMVTASCFMILSFVLLLQSVCNFDFYIIRSNYIAEKIISQEDYYVPCMPYDTISFEDSLNNIISFAFPSAGDSKQYTVALSAWDEYTNYRISILNKPINALFFAVQNWEYKNPLHSDSLCVRQAYFRSA